MRLFDCRHKRAELKRVVADRIERALTDEAPSSRVLSTRRCNFANASMARFDTGSLQYVDPELKSIYDSCISPNDKLTTPSFFPSDSFLPGCVFSFRFCYFAARDGYLNKIITRLL